MFPKLKSNQKGKEISESVNAHQMCDTGSEQYPKRKEYLKYFPMWENSKNQYIQSGEKSELQIILLTYTYTESLIIL